jgi:hypothetical protein
MEFMKRARRKGGEETAATKRSWTQCNRKAAAGSMSRRDDFSGFHQRRSLGGLVEPEYPQTDGPGKRRERRKRVGSAL